MAAARTALTEAEAATGLAQTALAQPFSQFIGSSHESDLPTRAERELLWELAALDPANDSVREKVINQWFTNENLSTQALRRHAQGLHAAVRLDTKMRDYSKSRVKIFGDTLAEELAKENQLDRLSSRGSALAGLAAQMEPEGAARAAQTLVSALEAKQEISPERLTNFATAIAALAARFNPAKAGGFANRLATAMGNAQETSAIRLAGLGIALDAFVAQIKSRDAAAKIATSGALVLMAKLENLKVTDAQELWALGTALAPLVTRMEKAEAKSLGDRLAKALLNPDETSDYRPWSLSRALVAAAGPMDAKDAKSIGDLLAPALENSQETSAIRLWNLSPALAAVAGRMEPNDAKTIGTDLARALKNPRATSADRLRSLSQALATAAGPMEPDARKSIGDDLAREAQTLPATEADRLASLASALEALATNIDVKEAASAAKAMATALVEQPVIDESRTFDLACALAALAVPMGPQDAEKISADCQQTVARALDNPEELESRKLSLLGRALARLSPLTSNASVARRRQLVALSNVLLSKAILDPPQPGEVEPEERKQLDELYARLSPQDLASVLKWPFCVGEAQKMALAALEKKTGGKFDGDVWRFVEQAPGLGIEDLDAPPKRPFLEDAPEKLEQVR